MNSRKQFGKKLADFQYLQFKYADMASDLITSRYFVYKLRLIVRKAAQLIDLDDANKTVYSAMAKKVAT
jgi:isobutyryl-CoA dehydrogenase